MSKVETYTVNKFDAWLQTKGDDTAGSYVKFEDYAKLSEKCEALTKALKHAVPWLPSADEELDYLVSSALDSEAES